MDEEVRQMLGTWTLLVPYFSCYLVPNLFLTWNPTNFVAVVATVPGYKLKTTSIWLGAEATTVDFILDPEVTPGDGKLLKSICDCNNEREARRVLAGFFWGPHLEIYFVLAVILAFLCILLQRRIKSNLSRSRQITKRSIVVWGSHCNIFVWLPVEMNFHFPECIVCLTLLWIPLDYYCLMTYYLLNYLRES